MRARAYIKADLIEAIYEVVHTGMQEQSVKESIGRVIDLFLEIKDAPADDKVNISCYTCGNVVRVNRETKEELIRKCAIFICEECHSRGKHKEENLPKSL